MFIHVQNSVQPTKSQGSALGGDTFIGLCASKFSCWDAAWWEPANFDENESLVFGLWDKG